MRARTMAILAIDDRDRDDGTRTAHLKETFLFKNIGTSTPITNNYYRIIFILFYAIHTFPFDIVY